METGRWYNYDPVKKKLKPERKFPKGFTLREGSTFEHLCHDVVPIVLQPIKITTKTNDDHPN